VTKKGDVDLEIREAVAKGDFECWLAKKYPELFFAVGGEVEDVEGTNQPPPKPYYGGRK
jgi:hypothetical protein